MILQFIGLVILMAIVFALGYWRGMIIKERKLIDMFEEPELSEQRIKKKRQKYYEFCKAFDDLMMEDDGGFSGDIAKSSRTDTNKTELK